MKSFRQQQKQVIGKLSPIEGSLSQRPFILKEYERPAGDFDFHTGSFKSAETHATKTAEDIIPSPGRKFEADINLQQSSAKVTVEQAGRKEKVGEFLNPEETDVEGAAQMIKGDTIFGKPIPTKSVKIKTEGLKSYTLQAQFVKKGESIFSLQKTKEGKLELEPFAPRKPKDVADFYAIGKTKAVNLRHEGKLAEATELESELEIFKKNFAEVDIDQFFKSKIPAEKTTLRYEPGIVSKIISSPSTQQATKGVGSTVIISSPSAQPKPTIQSEKYGSITSKSKPKITSRQESLVTSRASKSQSMESLQGSKTSILSKAKSKSQSFTTKSKSSYFVSKSPLTISRPSISRSKISKSPSHSPSPSRISKSISSVISKSITYSPKYSAPSKIISSAPSPSRSIPSSPRSSVPSKAPSSIPYSPTYSIPKPTYPTPTRETPPAVFGQLTAHRTPKGEPTKGKPKIDFIGNAPTTEIVGLYRKRADIIYGKERTSKLARQDIYGSKKGNFVSTRTRTVLRKPGHTFSEKKQKQSKVSYKKKSFEGLTVRSAKHKGSKREFVF